jgi:putative hydrolase
MLKIDLHIHTIASGHTYNTILEYINRAKELKMKIIGFSEHGPNMDGSANKTYFNCLDRLPRKIGNLIILRGVEANIINKKGDIDIADKIIKNKLDYVIAGFHKNTGLKLGSSRDNTMALINAIKSGRINMLAHPFLNNIIPFDVEKVCVEACEHNVLLEINMHYISDYIAEPQTKKSIIENLKILVQTVKKYKKKVIVNSDAHNIWELGDDSALKKIKKEIGLIDNLIINNYPKELLKLLKINA